MQYYVFTIIYEELVPLKVDKFAFISHGKKTTSIEVEAVDFYEALLKFKRRETLGMELKSITKGERTRHE